MSSLCSSCSKLVRNNQRGIFCDICNRWSHLSCTTLSVNDYIMLSNSSDSWFCKFCLETLFPFNTISDDVEFLNAIFNYMHSDNFNTDFLNNVCQMAFTAKYIGSGKDIDPDLNFIRQNCKDSPYLC